MIDTHAHLGDSCFDEDFDEVVVRAQSAGVTHCVVVGEHPREAERIQAIRARWPEWAMCGLGLFPAMFTEADITTFDALAESYSWDCIGEVGLDTWIVREASDRAWHEEVFRHVVRTAIRKDIPVNVHSRNTGLRVVEILRELGAKKVHLHAFDAKGSTVELGVEAGFYFSIPASVIHSPQKQKLVKRVPLEQLLLETDSPVLGPDRGSRNEPMNVKIALDVSAQIKDMTPEALERVTDENALRLYGRAHI